MELDLLQKNVLKAIDTSCAFEMKDIIKVYEVCKSFDRTINVLKLSSERAISLSTAIDWLGYR